MNFVIISQNHSCTKMGTIIWHMCDLCVIWQFHPCDMYIHLHTTGLLSGIMYSSILFCAKSASISLVVFRWWILLRRKNIFGKSQQSGLSLFVQSFSFSTFDKYYIAILVSSVFSGILVRNCSPMPCTCTIEVEARIVDGVKGQCQRYLSHL